jgi:hypothetical protein
MSDWRDIQKQFEELKKQGKLPEKQEKPAATGGGDNSNLNLLDVHGTKQPPKAEAPAPKAETPAPKKDEAVQPPKKEEPGSLFSLSGALGTVKGVGKGLLSLPVDTYHAFVNPDASRVYHSIATGSTARIADSVGFTASAKRTGSDMYTGVSYLASHPGQVFNRTVEMYSNASSEKKGVMTGQSIALIGTLFWGTGLGSKATKWAGFGKDVALAREAATAGELADLSRGTALLRDVNGVSREAKLVRTAQELEGAVLPAGRLGENTKFLNVLKDAKATSPVINETRLVEAFGGEARLNEIKFASKRLNETLDASKLLADGAKLSPEQLTLAHKIDDSMRMAFEFGPQSTGGKIAMKELRASVGRYAEAVGLDSRAVADINKALAQFEESFFKLSGNRTVLGEATRATAAEDLTATMRSKHEGFGTRIEQLQKELSAGSKAEDVIALQRARELEDSMKAVTTATDGAARERALADFEGRLNVYNKAAENSSFARSGKFEPLLSERDIAEFRTAAMQRVELGGNVAEVRVVPISYSAPEVVALREEQIAQRLDRARSITAGTDSAEAVALRQEAERLEQSMRNLSRTESALTEQSVTDRVAYESAQTARSKAAAELETRIKAWDELVKENKVARASGSDLSLGEQLLVENKSQAAFRPNMFAADLSGASRNSSLLGDAGKASIVEEGKVADTTSALSRGSAVGRSGIAEEAKFADSAAGLGKGSNAGATVDLAKGATAGEGMATGVNDIRTAARAAEAAGKTSEIAAAGREATLAREAGLAGRTGEVAGAGRGAVTAETIAARDLTKATECLQSLRSADVAGRLEQARALGDAAINLRVADVQQSVGKLEGLLSNRVASAADLQAVAGDLRASIRAYNEAIDASQLPKGSAASLYLNESLVNVTGGTMIRPLDVLKGYFVVNGIYGVSQGVATGISDLLTNARELAAQQASAGTVQSEKIVAAAEVARKDRSDSTAGQTAKDGTATASGASERNATSQTDAPARQKESAAAGDQGRFDAVAGKQEKASFTQSQTIYGDGSRLYLEHTIARQSFVGQLESNSRANRIDFSKLPGTTGETSWLKASEQKLQEVVNKAVDSVFRSGAMLRGLTSDNAITSLSASPVALNILSAQNASALSLNAQALASPKLDTQAVSRGIAAEETKLKPSWWATVFGDTHRPLLKADDTKPGDEPRPALILPPVRRIGGSDGSSQKIITPTFSASYVRMISNMVNNLGQGPVDARHALAGSSDRRGRGKGTSLQDEDKLKQQFPFLLPSQAVADSGVRTNGALFTAKAEDQEQKSMGKPAGGAAAAAPTGGNEDGATQALVAQAGLMPAATTTSTQDENSPV